MDGIEPFTIATLELPGGGRLGLCRLPGRSGALQADLAAIRDWGGAVIVSMTEADEMARKGAADLPAGAAEAGMAWRHFPIRDYGAPADADTRWPPLSAQLHAHLDRGESVLLHCAGGKGRSGMVALRLMTERGVPPDAALAAIRAARPGAVETDAQQGWGSAGPRV
jgi:hypothetical protein